MLVCFFLVWLWRRIREPPDNLISCSPAICSRGQCGWKGLNMSERPMFRRPGRRQGAGNHIKRVLARFSHEAPPITEEWLVTSKTPQKRNRKRSSRASRHERDAEEEACNQDIARTPSGTLRHPLGSSVQLGAARNEEAPRDQYCILCNSRYSQDTGSRPVVPSPGEVSPCRAGSHPKICIHRGRPMLSELRHRCSHMVQWRSHVYTCHIPWYKVAPARSSLGCVTSENPD